MLPALANVADLETRLGLDEDTLTGPDLARAQAALDDASALAREEARRTWVTDTGEVDAPGAVIRVVLGAALRNYRNPEGAISETKGPFSRTLRAAETGVYLTEAEQAIIRRYRPSNRALWTQPTTRDGEGADTLWMEDSFGFEPFPIGFVGEPWR